MGDKGRVMRQEGRWGWARGEGDLEGKRQAVSRASQALHWEQHRGTENRGPFYRCRNRGPEEAGDTKPSWRPSCHLGGQSLGSVLLGWGVLLPLSCGQLSVERHQVGPKFTWSLLFTAILPVPGVRGRWAEPLVTPTPRRSQGKPGNRRRVWSWGGGRVC